MKQKLITTPAADILVVELPEGAINVRIEKGYVKYDSSVFKSIIPPVYLSKKFKWQLLGRLPDITDSDKWNIVEPSALGGEYFKDYTDDCYEFATAKESFDSLLESNGIMFENPFGSRYNPDTCPIPEYRQEWSMNQYDTSCIKARDKHYLEWQEAQSKVLNKENTYLFKKVG